MASTLADILVTLTLETKDFSRKLKDVGQELNNFRNHVNNVSTKINSEFSQNVNGMSSSMEQVSEASAKASEGINGNLLSVNRSLFRVGNASKYMARTLGTDMASTYRIVKTATDEFEEFGSAGRFVSYEIKEQFGALPKHLQRYVQRLKEVGASTEAFARLNQKWSKVIIDNFVRKNDYLMKKTTQSQRLLDAWAGTSLAPLSRQFLNVGSAMEKTAKKGTALNIALGRIGPNASLKELRDQIRFVSQGVARARGAFIGWGVVSLVAMGGMTYLAATLDKRVSPAFENFKKTWVDAFQPWITAWATVIVSVLNFASAINEMINKFSEAHPVLFKMIGAFLLLTAVLGALLAPLAVTGIWAEGVAASFAALWAIIGPFVLGMLAVVGVAMAVAGALVVLWVATKELWKNSEAFRNAWINVWKQVKDAVVSGLVQPVVSAWNTLKASFKNLIATVTGGTGTMTDLWKWWGDRVAVVVTAIASVVLPILKGAFQILGMVISAVIKGVVAVIDWMAGIWKAHGTEITAVATMIWSYVSQAFGAIASYIKSIMPQVKAIITDTFNFIGAIIDFVMKWIAPVVVGAFKIIWEIIKFVMPYVLDIVKSTWSNIKNAISSAINIIQNVIQLFTNILQGNWKGAWENVKNILSNAVKLIWNLVQLWFLGKVLGIFKGFASKGASIVSSSWGKFHQIIKNLMGKIKTFVTDLWAKIVGVLKSKFTAILTSAVVIFGDLYTSVKDKFNSIKKTASDIFGKVKKAIMDPITEAKDKVLGIIDDIVSGFANMKIGFPKIKVPSLSIGTKSKTIAGKEFKVPDFGLKWNAKGAVFNGASILGGGQGVGEAGAEAVLPIQHKRYMKPFASAVASHLQTMSSNEGSTSAGGNQYKIEFHEPVVIREDADIQRIVDELERRRKISERAKGVFSF